MEGHIEEGGQLSIPQNYIIGIKWLKIKFAFCISNNFEILSICVTFEV